MSGICVVYLAPGSVSDTFVHAHIDRLPQVTGVVRQKGGVPYLGSRPMLSTGFAARAWRKCTRSVTGREGTDDITSAFAKAIRKSGADVVLAEFGPASVRVRAVCEHLNIPLVAHFHGYDAWHDSIIEKHREDYIALFQSAAAIVSGCRSMTDRLVALGAPREKVVTNYVCTVVPEYFPEVGGRPPDPPRFVAVGRFVEKKAPHVTLLAFAQVSRRCPTATLRFIGDGPLLGACRQLARALDVSDRVTFLGASTPEIVRRELQAATCFLQHSAAAPNGDREGTGISALEAAMTGLAICVTRHEGFAETMVDGETALLVDEYDVTGMAERMLLLATDTELARRLGANAARHVRAHFTMDKSIDRLARLLQAVARGADVDAIRTVIEGEWPSGFQTG